MKLAGEQIEAIAVATKPAIRAFVDEHKTEYQSFLRAQSTEASQKNRRITKGENNAILH